MISKSDATNPNSDREHFVCSAADLQIWSGATCFTFPFCIIILGIIDKTQSDFLYPDFESTIGIDFALGAAATSSCDEGKRLRYQPRHGTADQNIQVPPSTSEEGTDQAQFQEVKMDTTKSEDSQLRGYSYFRA